MPTTVADVAGTDPTMPDAPLIIGGKTRYLVYDHNSIVIAEKETGLNLLRAAVDDINATSLRGLLYASLLHESPELELAQVGSWIRPGNLTGIREAILKAWFESTPEPDPTVPAGNGQAQTATTQPA